MAHRIAVKTPTNDYMITIQRGRLAKAIAAERCAVVTNTTLAPLYGEALVRRLPDMALVIMPDGEQHKTLDTVAHLYAEFVKAGIKRIAAARVDLDAQRGVLVALGFPAPDFVYHKGTGRHLAPRPPDGPQQVTIARFEVGSNQVAHVFADLFRTLLHC